jgi:hypothetical protein
VIERNARLREARAAVGAHRAVKVEQPAPRLCIGGAPRGMRRQLLRARVRRAPASPTRALLATVGPRALL